MSEEPHSRPLLVVLADAYRGRRSGIVRATRGEGRMALALRDGRIVALETDGFMDASPSEEDRELAAMLAEAFAVGEPAVSRAAARQTLLEALRAPEARGFFEEGAAEGADPPLEFDTEELLREAAHSSDLSLVDAALGDLERPLRAAVDPASLQAMTLTPSEGYLMSRLDGVSSARAVLEVLPLEAEAARRCLFGLVAGGLVAFEDRPLARPKPLPTPTPGDLRARLQEAAADWAKDERRRAILDAHARLAGEKDHFVVLGLSREATEAEVKTAYFALARQFHPDTLGDLTDLGEAIQVVFARLGAAFDVLGQAKTRAAYEATLAPAKREFGETTTDTPPEGTTRRAPPSVPGAPLHPVPVPSQSPEDLAWRAEENLKRAEEMLGEGKFWDTIQLLESQVSWLAGRARHRGRLVLAQAYLHNPKWLHRGEETLRTVIREDPLNVEAYYLLGTIYKSSGLTTRAAGMFRKALELRPTHRPAADELAALDKAPPPPRRWFKGQGDRSE